FEELNTIQKIIDIIKHLFLPVIASSIHGVIVVSRYVSSYMNDVMNESYVLYAKARGIDNRVIFKKYILKNSLLPLITIIGLSIPEIVGGSFIFETIFSFPGIGRLGFEAMLVRDYPVILALGVITSFLVILGNLIADILYIVFDPRLR
ncbi:MAG: ABC transporter permease, partial [bacterium]|nr:ABC transporter permease [bacterium]